jgi:choline dehydrogenase-like flavoprotein
MPVADRPSLTVYTQATARRVILGEDDHTATGVEFVQRNVTKTITAKKEIVLSAGALNSPKLLELSGIGDPDVLQAAGVDVKVSNPYVSTNLQDHLLCGISFEVIEGIATGDDLLRNDPAAVQAATELYQAPGWAICFFGHQFLRLFPNH